METRRTKGHGSMVEERRILNARRPNVKQPSVLNQTGTELHLRVMQTPKISWALWQDSIYPSQPVRSIPRIQHRPRCQYHHHCPFPTLHLASPLAQAWTVGTTS